MREPRSPPPCFLFFGVFTGFEALFEEAKRRIEARFGPIHARGESPVFPFPPTQTYERTMGPGLKRKFFVLERRWPQDGLATVKHAAIEMEAGIRSSQAFPVERPINIDPGLLNDCRIILASTKDYSHRLYRAEGIWEEITLFYEKGAYRPLPWTYADFKTPGYHAFFEGFRKELLSIIRCAPPQGRSPASPPSA